MEQEIKPGKAAAWRRALLVVDVQPCFCEGGALGVAGGNAVAHRIADFVLAKRSEYLCVISTQDWHIDPGKHFSENPDFIDTWPPHGVAHTPEAELHPAIARLNFDDAVKKGQYAAAYSGFEGTNQHGDSLEQILGKYQVNQVDVVGIAESHCVKETALDARRLGWSVRVLSDLTVPVSPEQGQSAQEEMRAGGVELILSESAFLEI